VVIFNRDRIFDALAVVVCLVALWIARADVDGLRRCRFDRLVPFSCKGPMSSIAEMATVRAMTLRRICEEFAITARWSYKARRTSQTGVTGGKGNPQGLAQRN